MYSTSLKLILVTGFSLLILGCSDKPSDTLATSDINADITFKTINEGDVAVEVQLQVKNDFLSTVRLAGSDQLSVSNQFESTALKEHKNDVNEYKYKGTLPYREDTEYSMIFNRGSGAVIDGTSITFPEGLEVLFPLQASIFNNPQEEFRLAWEGGVLNTNYLNLDVFGECILSNDLKLSFEQNFGLTPNLNQYFSIISSLIDFDDLIERASGNKRSSGLEVRECSVTFHLNAIAENRVDPAFYGGKIKGIRTKAVTFRYIAE